MFSSATRSIFGDLVLCGSFTYSADPEQTGVRFIRAFCSDGHDDTPLTDLGVSGASFNFIKSGNDVGNGSVGFVLA